MQRKYSFLLLFVSIFTFSAYAQNTGDTIIVQAIDYSVTTRDVTAQFPTAGALSFEKVIMRYAMRCKNGLISPPIAGQTNIGCGEWDFSCNTYVHDPTIADSSGASIERYTITPDTNTSNIYSTTPTWTGQQVVQKNVSIQSIISEDTASIGSGTISNSDIVDALNNGGKTYVLLNATELSNAGLIAGDIDRFSFTNLGGTNQLLNFKVKMKHSNLLHLGHPDTTVFGNMQEVYFRDYTSTTGVNIIPFHTPFIWDGTSNLLIELSYKGASGNSGLQLESHNTSVIQSITSSNDFSLDMSPKNTAETPNYKGIHGNNSRTVEAWIKKSSSTADDLISWGTASAGRKFVFLIDATGRLRLEVASGNIVGSRIGLNDNEWHHIAVTFTGGSMINCKLYVDGVRDFPSSVNTGASMNTDTTTDFRISTRFHSRFWSGNVDGMRIWSTALPDSTLANWRYRQVNSSHPNYNNLEVAYEMDSQSTTLVDQSPHGRDAVYSSPSLFSQFIGEQHFKGFKAHSVRPNISLYQGNYNLTVVNDTLIDTTFNGAFTVTERTIFPKPGTISSDSIGVVLNQYWPQNNTLLDLAGNVVSVTSSNNTVTLIDSTLNYLNRNATKVEIMSFVTPYGINLDLGIEGKAWYFDVTDFLPVLQDNRRITLERGGQFQEEMDIQFLFIVGTPPQDVLSIQQIWPVTLTPFASIQNDAFFEPKTLTLDTTNASRFKIRSAITGHGQEGEFIPRNHFVNINGGPIEFNRTVWKECAENPIFPQGGTWIFDRAGWCPGMPTDVAEYDITSLIGNNDTVNVDYGVTTATGDSRYIVNNQLVSYGTPNFNLDARIIEVISPTDHTEYGKGNPVCDGAEIVIQNSGATTLTSVTVEYWINSGAKDSYTWTGSLGFMDQTSISLPTSSTFWNGLSNGSNEFHAEIITANGATDQYSFNDKINRSFEMADVLPSNNLITFFRTNSAAFESSYDVRDVAGNILFQRSNMFNNTVYRDTLTLASGCYTFNVYDTDDDGIDFFANNDGIGSVALLDLSGVVAVFDPDYGDGFSYSFTVSNPVGINEVDLGQSFSIYPNPAVDQISIETTGMPYSGWTIYDGVGRKIESNTTTSPTHYSSFNVDVSSYSNGIYFIHFNEKESTVVKKFVVNR